MNTPADGSRLTGPEEAEPESRPSLEQGVPGPKRTGSPRALGACSRALLVYRPESAPKPTLSDKHDAAEKAEKPQTAPYTDAGTEKADPETSAGPYQQRKKETKR